jgi:hypothetical protein
MITQTKDKENISINKLNYKQMNKRTNKILIQSNLKSQKNPQNYIIKL